MTAVTPVMEAGGFYAAADALYNEVDASSVSVAIPMQRSMWIGVEALACATMTRQPSTLDDVLMQLTVAATWMDAVADTFDDSSGFTEVARAIKATLERAALFHNRELRIEDGPCARLVEKLIAQLINCGAELPESVRLDPDRRFSWASAQSRYEAARAIADAFDDNDPRADAATEAEVAAQDDLIEQVPAPDGRALATKIVMAMRRAEAFEGALFDDHATAILADARRLAGVA